jgi:integration host factor subunit alpha
MALTKAHITEAIFSRNLFTKGECSQIVDAIFEIMKQTLESGEEIMISGFGKFQIRKKSRRRGRNPHSGAALDLPPRTVVTFKCSGVLREKMNSNRR